MEVFLFKSKGDRSRCSFRRGDSGAPRLGEGSFSGSGAGWRLGLDDSVPSGIKLVAPGGLHAGSFRIV